MEESRPSRPVAAMLAMIVGIAVLTAFAALVPTVARKLLLFSIAFGLCCGGVVVWAARELGLSQWPAVCLTVPLIFLGLTLIAVQGSRDLRAEQAATQIEPEQDLAMQILEEAAEDDPELADAMAERRQRRNPSFADYLALRVRPLGEWPQPWPIVYWAAELLIAATAGALLVSRLLSTRH